MMQKDSFKESGWLIPFNRVSDRGTTKIQFNFGDLLKLPPRITISWEKYFTGADAESNSDSARKLLFPKTQDDIKFIQEYWKRRLPQWKMSAKPRSQHSWQTCRSPQK
jgi:hypothetical protein